MQSVKERHEPVCRLAHDLIDSLAVIVGYSNLALRELPQGSMAAQHIALLHKEAVAMIEKVRAHQRNLLSDASAPDSAGGQD